MHVNDEIGLCQRKKKNKKEDDITEWAVSMSKKMKTHIKSIWDKICNFIVL